MSAQLGFKEVDMQPKYKVQYKFRDLKDGKPYGAWRYHDLLKTDNQTEAFDYLKTCPADEEYGFHILSCRRDVGLFG